MFKDHTEELNGLEWQYELEDMSESQHEHFGIVLHDMFKDHTEELNRLGWQYELEDISVHSIRKWGSNLDNQ